MEGNDKEAMREGGGAGAAGAVSLYQGGDALDGFPVLKAFQQYVDAEQAKAHRRLMSVCIFFTVLLLAVSGGFVMVIAGLDKKNPPADAALKSLSDSNVALQKQLFDQTLKLSERLAEQLASQKTGGEARADAELQRRNAELQAQLKTMELEKKLREEFAAAVKGNAAEPEGSAPDGKELARQERRRRSLEAELRKREAKIAADEKRLHEKEIELQRRNLYPDLYMKREVQAPQHPEPAASPAPVAIAPKPAARVAPVAIEPKPAAPVAPRPSATPTAANKPDDDLDLSLFDEVSPFNNSGENPIELKPAATKPANPSAAARPATAPKPAKPAAAQPQPQPRAANGKQLGVGSKAGAWTVPLE